MAWNITLLVTYTLCSKKYGTIQSSTWGEHTMEAIMDLDNLDCPSLTGSVGDSTNEGKTLEVINDDSDIIEFVIDDDPIDDSMSSIDSIIEFDDCFGSVGSGMRLAMYNPAVIVNEAIVGVFTVLYVLFGAVMNILILLVLCSGDPGDSRSPTSLYLTHLALVDLIFVMSYLHHFFRMYFSSFLPASFMKSICYWMETSRVLNMCVSVYMLALLSIDRYVAIVLSTKRSKFFNTLRKLRKSVCAINLICLLMWALGLALTFPITTRIEYKNGMCGSSWVTEGDEAWTDQSTSCKYYPTNEEISEFTQTYEFCRDFFKKSYTEISLSLTNEKLDKCACSKGEEYQKYLIIRFVFTYLIPLAIITFCYMNIVCVLRKTTTTSVQKSYKKDYKKRATILIFIMVIAYIIFWTPFHVFGIMEAYGGLLTKQQCQYFGRISVFLSWLHGVLNPVIYSFLSYGYRNRLKKLWARVRGLLTCFKPCYAEAPYPRSATQTKETESSKLPKSDELFPTPKDTAQLQTNPQTTSKCSDRLLNPSAPQP